MSICKTFHYSRGQLREFEKEQFPSEDQFQDLLAQNPDILPGEDIFPPDPCRWLLIGREVPVPDGRSGKGRWSLDHLFVDQHGIPTLVEVKRSSDTRLRREVIGQMMDYYANALRNWPRDFFRTEFYRQRKEQGSVLFPVDLLEPNETEEEFWDKVSENFSREWIRLLFVADEIPFELKESVQVWNNSMKTTEALCVEIRRFVSHEEEFLVPRLFGSPSLHNLVARERLKGNWWDRNPNDKGALFWGLVRNEKVRQITRKLYQWIPEESLKNPGFWGGGAKQAYFVHAVPTFQGWKTVFKVYNDDYVNVVLEGMTEEEARELQGRLNRISGIKVDVIRKKGGLKESLWIKTLKLESDEIFEEFLSVIEWLGSQFTSADSYKEPAALGRVPGFPIG